MVNCEDVIEKFKEIRKLYGNPKGHMIFTIHNNDLDIKSIPLQWDIVYLTVARSEVYRAYIKINVFQQELQIPIYKPYKPVEVLEFEDFFNFQSHCSDYDPNRLIACLPLNINSSFNIDQILQTENIDFDYARETLRLLCLGGFIKYWKGLHIFCEWFKTEASIEIDVSNSFKLLLNNFIPIVNNEV